MPCSGRRFLIASRIEREYRKIICTEGRGPVSFLSRLRKGGFFQFLCYCQKGSNRICTRKSQGNRGRIDDITIADVRWVDTLPIRRSRGVGIAVL